MERKERCARILAINDEIRNLKNAIDSEKRALTEDESKQINDLATEARSLDADNKIEMAEQIKATAANVFGMDKRSIDIAFAEQAVEAMHSGKAMEVRAATVQDLSSASNLVPLTIGDIIEPLEKGLILSKVGVKMQTGLVGDWKYPVIAAVEATIASENAEISDSKIDITAVQPTPHRCSLSIFVSNTAMNQTNEELRAIVLAQMTKGLERLINKWMFSKTAIASGCTGPFVAPTTVKSYTGAVSYATINELRGAVDTTGVQPDGTQAFVINNAMAAVLRVTPKDAGSGRFILEDGKIDGIPAFVTEYAPADTIYFGYFGYTLIGQFGTMSIVVDPYTGAKKNGTYFVLNSDFDIKAARPEAFGSLSLTSE